MGIVDLALSRQKHEDDVWRRYCDARDIAERSRDIQDGRAAGRIWREWLTLFQSTDQNEADREFDRVVAMKRRG